MTICIGSRVAFVIMLLGILGGIASIVLIVLGKPDIGGFLAICWIPATAGFMEWRCRKRETNRSSLEAPKPPDVRINIPTNSPCSK